jgi:plasmid maintenance system antidote protein VapI
LDSERFKHLRDYIGYDNARLAKMLNISVAEVEEFCSGRKPIPATMAKELEAFADWSSEVGDTTVKRDLAKKHLGKEGR